MWPETRQGRLGAVMVKAHLVVVEDDPDLREVLKESLSREGYEVSVAEDGLSGLELIREVAPDLVCLDVMMPGLDGIEVCRELRADKAFRRTPILMLTAKGDEADVVLGLGIGADDIFAFGDGWKQTVGHGKTLSEQAG